MSARLRRILSLQDFEEHARRHLPRPVFGYVAGAVEDNASERANRASFVEYEFKPRVLVDVSQRSMSQTLFGVSYAAPVGIAPMGLSALSAYRGDLVQALAAAEANIPFIMSGSSLIRLEDVMEQSPGAWFQAYLPGDPEQIVRLIDRVEQARVQTLVITVDTPVGANRENNVRAGFSAPLRPSPRLAWDGISHPRWLFGTFLKTLVKHGMPHFENNYAQRGAPILSSSVLRDFSDRSHLTWDHISTIRKRWTGPLVIKGILSAQGAGTASARGIDGIIVSNHAGRQLDGSAAPLRVLPEIVAAAGKMTVMIDSGIRRGTDVMKALALGAQCAFVGRPFNYAAAIAGQAGVAHAVSLLLREISCDMAMLGITRLDELSPEWLLRTSSAR
jgi:L-lactate dehydrogenase (cytochrome)